jgi:hypothetical protein
LSEHSTTVFSSRWIARVANHAISYARYSRLQRRAIGQSNDSNTQTTSLRRRRPGPCGVRPCDLSGRVGFNNIHEIVVELYFQLI